MSNNFKEFNIDILNDNISSGLKIKVNDEPVVDADVQLPGAVRPFILISQKDTIRLRVKRADDNIIVG